MPDQDTILVPLYARDGSILAHTVIDATDGERITRWRWGLDQGYAVRTGPRAEGRRKIRLHREILGLTRGDGLEGDHIDRDRLNNRRINLRVLTRSGNMQNVPARSASSTYRGVHWHKRIKKWTAQISVNHERYHLGYFDSEDTAAEVAHRARTLMMPFATD